MSKIVPIKQPDANACGPSSILMAARHLGVPLAFRSITAACKHKQREGLSNAQLVKALSGLSFKAKVMLGVTWGQLRKANRSDSVIIVSWMLNGYIGHFSVVDQVTKDRIFLADPRSGKIICFGRIHFLRLWHDYRGDAWFPAKSSDIQLRWMVVVTAPKN